MLMVRRVLQGVSECPFETRQACYRMPECIAPAVMPPSAFWLDKSSVKLDTGLVSGLFIHQCELPLLADIPQKRLAYAVFVATVEERIHLEFVSKLLRKGNVSCVVQPSLAEDEHGVAVL